MSDLTLFICETLKEEITRLNVDFSTLNVHIYLYPHYCTSESHNLDEITSFLSKHIQSGQKYLFFGDNELSQRGLLPPEISHAGPDSCNSLIAPKEFVDLLSSQGAYVILPGWLHSWERYVTELGLDPQVPTSYFSSSLSEVIVLDTGIVVLTQERITSFETFSGLPIRIIPMGISHLLGLIQNEIFKVQCSLIKKTHTVEVSSALENAARQMAVITLLGDLAQVSEEKEVISRVLITCHSLFAPESVRYLSIYSGKPGELYSIPPDTDPERYKAYLFSVSGDDFRITLDEAGFCIAVVYQQETVGILGIFGVSVPNRIKEYLNLTLSFIKFLGLAIRNARSWQDLHNLKTILERTNGELQEKNKKLLAISKELSDNEQFIKGIVNSTQVGIAVLDPKFRVLFWNPELERMFGLIFNNIMGKNLLEVFPHLINSQREQYLFQALSGEKVYAPDFELSLDSSGNRIWISSIFNPIFDADMHLMGVLINVYDITERKESEEDLVRAYDAIQTAQSKLAILSSVTRHDILNRVMAINSYCWLLIKKISDEKELEQLNNMAVAGKDIQHLIEFTREYQEVGIKKPIWQRIRDIMKKDLIQSVLAEIVLTIRGDPIEIYADPMLEKVLYNLVENSKRHGERVSEISISWIQEGDSLLVAYSDNGVGVAEEEKELIFKQGHGKNTGMGLFLINEILELTKISIRECGVPGEGVRFEIMIPQGSWRTFLQISPGLSV